MDKEFEPGDIVTLHNLVKSLDLNDCKARLIK